MQSRTSHAHFARTPKFSGIACVTCKSWTRLKKKVFFFFFKKISPAVARERRLTDRSRRSHQVSPLLARKLDFFSHLPPSRTPLPRHRGIAVVIETSDRGINRHAEVDRSAAAKSMLRAHSRLEELVGVKLEQLQVPQQQGGHGDLLGARDFCELAKVSDISVAPRVLCILLFSLLPLFLASRQKLSATLSAERC